VSTVDNFPTNEQSTFVATIQWPGEKWLRDDRLARGEASLLLVEPGAAVPETDAILEDWASTTATPSELDARREAVMQRVVALRGELARNAIPSLDLDNVFRFGDRSLIVAPIEVRLLKALLEHAGTVLSRDALTSAVWPDGAPKSNSLSVRLTHLRRRLAPLGLSILTFPNHGYMLELPDDDIEGRNATS
jgi:hypothetical protein